MLAVFTVLTVLNLNVYIFIYIFFFRFWNFLFSGLQFCIAHRVVFWFCWGRPS